MTAPLRWMPAKAYGGKLTPTVVVVHCTESDNNAGTAESLAGPTWFGGPAGTSAHKMFDRDSGVEMVRRAVVAYHAGPRGNTVGVSYEFCGRASWSSAKWREPAQLNMLRLAAVHIVDDLRAMAAPARWLSLVQLARRDRGLCTHNDIRLALGGTTHSDPGPNFPYAELLGYVQASLAGHSPQEDDFMSALSSQEQRDLYNRIMGRDVQRWLKGGPDLASFVTLDQWEDGAWPARSADVADVIGILRMVQGGDERVLTEISSAFHQEADRDAVNQAALTAQLTSVGGGDPDVLAAALRSALGEQLAADVAARLTVTAN